MTTFHVRYEILDDPSQTSPQDPAADSFPWGVRAIGLPGGVSAYGVGDTLEEALGDLVEAVQAALGAGPVPDELTREIAITIGDAA